MSLAWMSRHYSKLWLSPLLKWHVSLSVPCCCTFCTFSLFLRPGLRHSLWHAVCLEMCHQSSVLWAGRVGGRTSSTSYRASSAGVGSEALSTLQASHSHPPPHPAPPWWLLLTKHLSQPMLNASSYLHLQQNHICIKHLYSQSFLYSSYRWSRLDFTFLHICRNDTSHFARVITLTMRHYVYVKWVVQEVLWLEIYSHDRKKRRRHYWLCPVCWRTQTLWGTVTLRNETFVKGHFDTRTVGRQSKRVSDTLQWNTELVCSSVRFSAGWDKYSWKWYFVERCTFLAQGEYPG